MTTQLSTRTVTEKLATLRPEIEGFGCDWDKFKKEISFAVQAVQANPKLAECSQDSILKAVYNVALTGLSLNPIHKLAALTPRWSKTNGNECVLFPQYQGLVKLLTDTGSITHINTQLVYEGDSIEIQLGTNPYVKHIRQYKTRKVILCYAIAKLHNGAEQIESMEIEEIHEIRDRSDSYKAFAAGKIQSCIWVEHEGEMCRKTVLRRITKYLPKTDRWERLNQAIEIDNAEYEASWEEKARLEALINNSTYDDDAKGIMDAKVREGLSQSEAENMKKDLIANQQTFSDHGRTGGQTEIRKQVEADVNNPDK